MVENRGIAKRCHALLTEISENIENTTCFGVNDCETMIKKIESIKEIIETKKITKDMTIKYRLCPVCSKFTSEKNQKHYRISFLTKHLLFFHRPNYQSMDDEIPNPIDVNEEQFINGVLQFYYRKQRQPSNYKYCDECREMCTRSNFSRHILTGSHLKNVEIMKLSQEIKYINQETFMNELYDVFYKAKLSPYSYHHLRPFLVKFCGRALISDSQFRRQYYNFNRSLQSSTIKNGKSKNFVKNNNDTKIENDTKLETEKESETTDESDDESEEEEDRDKEDKDKEKKDDVSSVPIKRVKYKTTKTKKKVVKRRKKEICNEKISNSSKTKRTKVVTDENHNERLGRFDSNKKLPPPLPLLQNNLVMPLQNRTTPLQNNSIVYQYVPAIYQCLPTTATVVSNNSAILQNSTFVLQSNPSSILQSNQQPNLEPNKQLNFESNQQPNQQPNLQTIVQYNSPIVQEKESASTVIEENLIAIQDRPLQDFLLHIDGNQKLK